MKLFCLCVHMCEKLEVMYTMVLHMLKIGTTEKPFKFAQYAMYMCKYLRKYCDKQP